MAFRWQADDGTTLNVGLVALWFFRGPGPVLLRYPLFVIFQEIRTPCLPLWIRPCACLHFSCHITTLHRIRKKQMSSIRKYHNHTLQPNQPNLSDNSPKLHRVDPSTNLIFSKLDSFSLDRLSLFIHIENDMQIKRGGNVPDPPPSSEKSQMAVGFIKKILVRAPTGSN